MAIKIGGLGSLGVEFEETVGEYVPPTKFLPIRSESLNQPEDKIWRENIRGIADVQDPIQGYYTIEGDVTFEVTHDALLYFLYAARCNIVKDADTPEVGVNTYTFTPAHVTEPTTGAGVTDRKTLSITVERGDGVFGYVGCSIGQLQFSFENGLMLCTASIRGRDVSSQSAPTPTYEDVLPFGPEDNAVLLGANPAPVRTDIDALTISINDAAEALNRISGNRGADIVMWGQREVTASVEHDFANMDDYDAYRNQTLYEVIARGLKGDEDTDTERRVETKIRTAAATGYPVNLSSLGDLIRASIDYRGFYDSTNLEPYEILVVTDTDIS